MDEVDLRYRGSFAAKRARHVSDAFRKLNSVPYEPIIRDGLDVDYCRYRTFEELPYVSNLCALLAAQLETWDRRFIVHLYAICCKKTISVSYFRYEGRSFSIFWNMHVRAERRAMSALGRFVQYHLMCAFNQAEAAGGWCFVRIPAAYDALQPYH